VATALETTVFDAVDFTDLAAVKTAMNTTSSSTALDGLIATEIGDISAEMTRYLGFHTLSASRTETYVLRHGKRVLTLDARPVTVLPTSLKIANHPDDFSAASEIDSRDYVVHQEAGWIKFSRRMARDTSFVRVTYTGGLAADSSGIITNYPELARAAALQVKFLHERRDSIGGSVTTLAGAKTTYNSQYGLLAQTRRVLDAYRRQAV